MIAEKEIVHSKKDPCSDDKAYAYCRQIAKNHYENFPVASWFIPKQKREHFYAAYAFMRMADDFADNPVLEITQRLHLLHQWQAKLNACYEGYADDLIFVALKKTIQVCAIPKEYFDNLLNAFKVDLFKNHYQNFDELLEYCSFSANPVGRIVLCILGYHNHPEKEKIFSASDSVCTALQLTNHWQDVFMDRKIGRCYLPQDDMRRHGYSPDDWEKKITDHRFQRLMSFQVDRSRAIFDKGKTLLAFLKKPERYEILLIWLGGMRILEKIEKNGYDVLNRRPSLTLLDALRIGYRFLTFRPEKL